MKYRKIKPYNYTELELRSIWSKTYCEKDIFTFDNIKVDFFSSMFNHCFYDSANRKKGDKSILSYNRLEKIYWIKDALEDVHAIRKVGWNKKAKSYDKSRRVAIVKNNYIVVIVIYANKRARFITAYEVNNEKNLELIKKSPDWI